MEDETKIDSIPHQKQVTMNTTMVIGAIILALVAGLIAWSAYNQNGRNLQKDVSNQSQQIMNETKDNVSEKVMETSDTANRAAARARIETQLLSLKARVESNNITTDNAREVAMLRKDLNDAYLNASDDAKQSIKELDANLQKLETSIQNGSNDVMAVIDMLLAKLREPFE